VVSTAIATELQSYTSGKVVRLAGANRYDTAVAISSASFSSAEVVYVATGLNFPDALAAGPVAGVTAGPLLLVPGTSLPASVQAELSRLDPDAVVVLGSAGVVSENVITQIKAVIGG
jgi:putative cell wall-binding protein